VVAPEVPPADKILYRVRIEVVDLEGSLVTTQKDSPTYIALWRMPLNYSRTGCPDPGEDDWCSQWTGQWLRSFVGILGSFNDISGEHSQNLGHAEHRVGTDVDIRQFDAPDFPTSAGGMIYARLAALTEQAFADPVAEGKVNQWVLNNRDGIETLIMLFSVKNVRIGIGGTLPNSLLPNGWYKSLLLHGSVQFEGATLTLPCGEWENPLVTTKVIPTSGHNDHHHVALVGIGEY
jgi:hypothetical protein